jgi:hypothetical protein
MAVFQAISDRAYVRPAQRRPSTIPVQDNKSAIATIRSSSAPWPYSGTSAVALRRADAYVKSAQRKLAAAQHGAFGA